MAKGNSFSRNRVQVTGLKELEAALSALPRAVARNALKRTLKLAAKPIEEVATEKAPVLSGTLSASIKTDFRKPKNFDKGKIAYHKVLKTGGDKKAALAAMRAAYRQNPASFAQVFIGPSVDAPHGSLQEFGTAKAPAQPFMRPAWDEKQEEALNIISSELGAQIEKSAARLAKRKARAR